METFEQQINDIIEPSVNSMGFGIVRLRFFSRTGPNVKLLEILVERLDGSPISVKECVDVNRHISALLDVDDVIEGRYNLEVSSAGVERPLVKPSDFEKYKGYVISVKLQHAVANAKKYQGTLESIDQDQKVKLKLKDGVVLDIEYQNIKDAKLVLTDELYKKIVK